MAALVMACGQDQAAPVGAAPASKAPLTDEVACPDANPLRNAYFGDFHVHTELSSDAWMFDTRTSPDDAYRFAFEGEVMLAPLDDEGRPTRRYQSARPLDFMAVTDHAEFFGESRICATPGKPGYESSLCEAIRAGEGRSPELLKQIFSPFPKRDKDTCGEDLSACAAETLSVWKEVQASAAKWNKSCEHTSFVAYEYSSFRMGSNLHRNVIFRNEEVIDRPISFLDAKRDYELWEALSRECLDADSGCDVIAIPHNSNISNGRMFSVNYPGDWTRSSKADQARLRMRVEPIIEVMQHKGDSECRNGLPGIRGGVDEFCDFEKFESMAFTASTGGEDVPECYEGAGADWWFHKGPDCLSPQSYARTALIEGLRQEEEIGVNPFKFGLSASTDTHNGIGGAVDEANYPGHLGIGDDSPAKRASGSTEVAGNANNNPGGLIGVLAEQNTRDSIFDALKRKEVFGTSGPRMQVRFYGSDDLPADLCGRADRLAVADAAGVPMGGDLTSSTVGADGPTFLVIAQADAGTAVAPGTPLERLQVVKGWIDDEGVSNQHVYDLAGSLTQRASVNLSTCEPGGEVGFQELCSVWRDPDFDASKRALYYLRAVENPTCRYSQRACLELETGDRPAACSDGSFPATVQERAWSSPIWYTPEAGAAS
ncbi:MAG: DUF3604 domain-containing protein [Myxococcota bacterium]